MDILTQYVNAVFTIFIIIIFIRILLSWVPNPPTGRVMSALWAFFHESTEWYLRSFRRIVPSIGMFDFSPIVALIALYVGNVVVVRVLEAL
ncbi:MAG: YggT family protein [Miltoncostaeaceae bacterium]